LGNGRRATTLQYGARGEARCSGDAAMANTVGMAAGNGAARLGWVR
jgi:hypothetical protein